MMVPKQLANTMELIRARSVPAIGAVAMMVIEASCRAILRGGAAAKRMQSACRAGKGSAGVYTDQLAPAAGTLISVGRMIAAAITSTHNPANACSIVAKPPCSYSHATSPTDAPAAV